MLLGATGTGKTFTIANVIVLRTGDMVPVDCKILEGSLEVDESLLTFYHRRTP